MRAQVGLEIIAWYGDLCVLWCKDQDQGGEIMSLIEELGLLESKAAKYDHMTSANAINCVVSRLRSVPRKPSIKNLSLCGGRFGEAKDFLKGSLQGTSHEKITKTTLCGGGLYDCESIQTFQPIELQPRCEDSNSEDRFSLQVQYQLSHYLDTKIQEETALWKGEGSA